MKTNRAEPCTDLGLTVRRCFKNPTSPDASKGVIPHDEQFFLLQSYFKLHSINLLLFIDTFQICVYMFSQTSAGDVLYLGHG